MATVPPCLHNESHSTKINYKNLKVEYNDRLLTDCAKDVHINSELQFYQSAVEDLLEQVKNMKRLKEANMSLVPSQLLLDETYDLRGEVLYKKKLVGNTLSIMHMLSRDDCFDYFFKEHKEIGFSKDTSTLVQRLTTEYVFPKICLDTYLKCCANYDIFEEEVSSLKIFNQIAQLRIDKMGIVKDPQIFQYLLMYIDKLTNFTILRPLLINSEEEVSIELFKIFLEFGPPERLHIYENERDFFYADVFKRIKNLMPSFNIEWAFKTTDSSNIFDPVQEELVSWTEETGSSNWEIGCYIVQWKLNGTKHISTELVLDNMVSPYNKVFENALNSKPSQSIVTNTNSRRRSKSLKNLSTTDLTDSDTVLFKIDKSKKVGFLMETLNDESADDFSLKEESDRNTN